MILLFFLACAAVPSVEPPADPALPPHRVFSSAEAAIAAVVGEGVRVVGVGEVHATTDGPAIPTTISRFTDRLLPVMAPRMTDLVIETWRVGEACGEVASEVVAQVEVDTKRPEATKSEIVLLAEKASSLGMTPHDLALSCAEYDGLMGEDGDVSYDALLALLTVKLGEFAAAGLATDGAAVALYGGAMHNDVFPVEGLEDYSYGVAAREAGGDAYVELDLYAPELIRGREALIEAAWAPLLEQTGPDRALLYERGPGSYVLFLEATAAASGGSPTP